MALEYLQGWRLHKLSGSLCQCSVILPVKKSFLMFRKNLLCFSLCRKGTLLAHVQLGAHQDPQVLFCKAALQLGCPPAHTGAQGCFPSGAGLLLVELHELPVSLFLQPAEVPLDGSMTLWCISHSSQFCVISKFAEGTLSLHPGH